MRRWIWPVLLLMVVVVPLQPRGAVGQTPESPAPPETTLQSKMRIAMQLFQQGKDAEAEKLFLEIVAQDPRQAAAYNSLGIIYSRNGQHEKSIAAFEKLLAISPDYAGAYFGLGVAYKYLRNADRALENFRKAVSLYPNYTVAWLNIAVITDALNNVEESVHAYQRVMETADKSSEEFKQADDRLKDIGEDPEVAKRVRELMNQAGSLVKKGDRTAAVPLYKEAASLLPKSRTVRKILADEAAAIGDFATVETALQEQILIAPDDLPLRFQYGKFLSIIGKVDDATKAFQDLLSLAVNRDDTLSEVEKTKDELFRLLDQKAIQDHLLKADVFTLELKWKDAIGELLAAQHLDPDSTLILFNLLRVYQQGGYLDQALTMAHELLLLEPNSREVHLLAGQAYQGQHFFFQAMASYLKVLSLSDDQQRGDLPYTEALAGVQNAAVALKKSAPQAINNFAKSLRSKAKGDVDDAKAYLRLAIAVAPEAPLMHYQLGKIFVETGETDQAIEELEKAVDLSPGLYAALLTLSEQYVKKRWFNKATAAFDTLLGVPVVATDQTASIRSKLEQDAHAAREELAKAHEESKDLFQQGQAAFASGDAKGAISHLLSAHYAEPDNPHILYSLGVVYAANQNGKAAVKAFQDALAIEPSHVEAKFRLGVVLEASEMYGAATTTYREVVAMPGAKDHPEYAEAQARLAQLKATFKRLHEAETHELLGLPVVESKEKQTTEQLMLARWHLKRATILNPKVARYSYNLGLIEEKVAIDRAQNEQRVVTTSEANLDLLHEAIQAYHAAIEQEATYLPPYLRLGQIYETVTYSDQALAIYGKALAIKPLPESQQGARRQIEQRVAVLNRRFWATVSLQHGFDSNFTLSDPKQEDHSNTVSADVTYLLVKRSKLQFSLGFQAQTTYFLRSQVFFQNSNFSAGLQGVFSPTWVGNLKARSQLSFVKDSGLTSATSEETASLTHYGRWLTASTVQYSYLGVTNSDNANLNVLQHQVTLTGNRRLFGRYTVDLSYVGTLHRTANSTVNDYAGQQVNLRTQWPVAQRLLATASVSQLWQNFLYVDTPDSEGNLTRRRNSLLGYGGGLSWSLSPSTSVSADLQVQKNESNLGPSVATSIADVLLGRNSALGSYTKRVITVGLSYSF